MRAWWKHISDPSLWPNERLFYELFGQALQGRAHTTHLLDGIVDNRLDRITAPYVTWARIVRGCTVRAPPSRRSRGREGIRERLRARADAPVR